MAQRFLFFFVFLLFFFTDYQSFIAAISSKYDPAAVTTTATGVIEDPEISSAPPSIPTYVIANTSLPPPSTPTYVIANSSGPPPSTPTYVTINSSSSISTARSIYYLNSSLPSTWINSDPATNMTLSADNGSRVRVILSMRRDTVGFVAGFHCFKPCTYSTISVVIAAGSSIGDVVWSANAGRPVRENATLQLRNGHLVLRDSDGVQVWSTDYNSTISSYTIGNSSKQVQGINMTISGNLLLFDNDGSTVWQSVDHPTDTLLLGQRLNENQMLVSASFATTNQSRGMYYATIKSANGFAVFTHLNKGESLMYYQLVHNQNQTPIQTPNNGSNYAELQKGKFLVNLGTSQIVSGEHAIAFGIDFVEYMRLGGDGGLRIYRQETDGEPTMLADLVSNDLGQCQFPRICGEYGVCREGQCSCPVGGDGISYFRQTQLQLPDRGCSRITPLSCQDEHQPQLIPMNNLTYFNVIDTDAASQNIKDIQACKEACLSNCSCVAAIFRYERNVSDGYCYMPSEVLSLRDDRVLNHNFTSFAFIKAQPATPPPSEGGRNLIVIIVSSSAGAFLLFCAAIAAILFMGKSSKVQIGEDEENEIGLISGTLKRFSYEELRVATGEFKEIIGKGGFGTVFKGAFLDGTTVAIKRLDKLGPGVKGFLAEVESIGSIHHFNLVSLIGFCSEKSCRFLVFEFMSNGSLDRWIFDRDQALVLNWETRKKIILGIAKGLAYLHEECKHKIIHLDIKPENILLDKNFNAKVSDFGLSKLVDRDQSQVHTTMRGTPGYMAPEWGLLRITVKVDIYSFGILLLEVVCCRRNLGARGEDSEEHLLRLLQKKAMEDKVIDIVQIMDQDMKNHSEEVKRMIKIGAWCLQDDHTRRPPMSTVVKALEGLVEVDPNIRYNFTHAMVSHTCFVDKSVHASEPPLASVLSCPR